MLAKSSRLFSCDGEIRMVNLVPFDEINDS